MVIQLRVTACMPNSFPMDGRAMFTEDPIKGVRKEVSVATISAACLLIFSSRFMPTKIINFSYEEREFFIEGIRRYKRKAFKVQGSKLKTIKNLKIQGRKSKFSQSGLTIYDVVT